MENLTGALSVLWRGRYLVLAGLVVGVVCGRIATAVATKVYEATAVVQVQSSEPIGAGADPFDQQEANQALAGTYATLIESSSFLAGIRPNVAGGRYSTSDLEAHISAQTVTQNAQNTDLIQVIGTGSSQSDALAVTDGVARAFVSAVESAGSTRSAGQERQLKQQIAAISAQIAQLTARRSRSAADLQQIASLRTTSAALTTQLATAIANDAASAGSVSLVGPPVAAGGPIQPKPALDLVVGFLLGLIAGIGLAWLRSVLDHQLHSANDVERLVDAPVLALVPFSRRARSGDPLAGEAFDILRTNLTFVSPGKPPAVVTVTSPREGEGKTAVAEGLARSAAASGMKVLLVDGDLRTPALTQRTVRQRSRASATAADWPRPAPVVLEAGPRTDQGPIDAIALEPFVSEVSAGYLHIARFAVLPTGRAPVNPTSVLARPETAALVERARATYDLIVFDSPPLDRLADAAILAAVSDASIVVVQSDETAKNDLLRAVETLGRAPAPVAGVVILQETRAPHRPLRSVGELVVLLEKGAAMLLEKGARYRARTPRRRRSWWPPSGDPRPFVQNAIQKQRVAIQKQRVAIQKERIASRRRGDEKGP